MKSTINEQGDRTTVTLKGNLTEECEDLLLDLRGRLKTAHVVFECADIKYINSYGTGRWLMFVRELGTRATFEFRNCPVNFIEYATMLPSFIGKGWVASALISYVCPSCGHFDSELVDGASVAASRALPEVLCRKCGTPTDPDVDAESLLGFLKARGS